MGYQSKSAAVISQMQLKLQLISNCNLLPVSEQEYSLGTAQSQAVQSPLQTAGANSNTSRCCCQRLSVARNAMHCVADTQAV